MRTHKTSFFHLAHLTEGFELSTSHFDGKSWQKRRHVNISSKAADAIVRRLIQCGARLFACSIGDNYMDNHFEYRY